MSNRIFKSSQLSTRHQEQLGKPWIPSLALKWIIKWKFQNLSLQIFRWYYNLIFSLQRLRNFIRSLRAERREGKNFIALHILLQEYNFPSLQLSYLILFVSIRQFLVSFLCYPHLLIILTHFLLLRQFFLQTLVI